MKSRTDNFNTANEDFNFEHKRENTTSMMKFNSLIKERASKRYEDLQPLDSFLEFQDYLGHDFRKTSEAALKECIEDEETLNFHLKSNSDTDLLPVQHDRIEENNKAHVIASL